LFQFYFSYNHGLTATLPFSQARSHFTLIKSAFHFFECNFVSRDRVQFENERRLYFRISRPVKFRISAFRILY